VESGFPEKMMSRQKLEHDPEKGKPVFGKDHAPMKYLGHDPVHRDRIMVWRANGVDPRRLARQAKAGARQRRLTVSDIVRDAPICLRRRLADTLDAASP
jgi:hypothetical protein